MENKRVEGWRSLYASRSDRWWSELPLTEGERWNWFQAHEFVAEELARVGTPGDVIQSISDEFLKEAETTRIRGGVGVVAQVDPWPIALGVVELFLGPEVGAKVVATATVIRADGSVDR